VGDHGDTGPSAVLSAALPLNRHQQSIRAQHEAPAENAGLVLG